MIKHGEANLKRPAQALNTLRLVVTIGLCVAFNAAFTQRLGAQKFLAQNSVADNFVKSPFGGEHIISSLHDTPDRDLSSGLPPESRAIVIAAGDSHRANPLDGRVAKDVEAQPRIPKSDTFEKLPPAEQYCARVSDIAASSQFVQQRKALAKAQKDVESRIAALAEKAEELRLWSRKREDFLKKATNSLIEIYSKMKPEVAASQLVAMTPMTAAAIVAKLPPKAASAILAEMEPQKAARLSSVLAGAVDIDDTPSAMVPAGKP